MCIERARFQAPAIFQQAALFSNTHVLGPSYFPTRHPIFQHARFGPELFSNTPALLSNMPVSVTSYFPTNTFYFPTRVPWAQAIFQHGTPIFQHGCFDHRQISNTGSIFPNTHVLGPSNFPTRRPYFPTGPFRLPVPTDAFCFSTLPMNRGPGTLSIIQSAGSMGHPRRPTNTKNNPAETKHEPRMGPFW
jgi:hypothetical protein